MTDKPDIVERLRELALAATPGEWRWWTSNSWRRLTAHAADGSWKRDGDVLCPLTHPSDRHPDCAISEADQEYIAAANPQAILALLDEITALRKRLEDAEQLVQTHATQQCAAVIRECRADAERERDEAYERAAKVCDEWPADSDVTDGIAAAIRALAKGEKQQPQKTGD